MKEYPREEIIWISDGIRGMLLAYNGTEKFPEEFYNECKNLVGWQREYNINE